MLSEWCLSKLQESRKLMLFDVLTMMEGAALACSCAALEGFLGTMHASASPPPKKKKRKENTTPPPPSLPAMPHTHICVLRECACSLTSGGGRRIVVV